LTELRVATLFSGKGSNAQNLIKRLNNKEFFGKEISFSLALSNKKDAEGIQKCKDLGVNTIVLESRGLDREEYDRALVDVLLEYKIELVLLAGFMRILTPYFTKRVKALNIHPSLLPLYKGGDAMRMSFESDMKIAGVSVHEVNEELDGGKIVAQDIIYKKDDESFEEFKSRMHALEHILYPKAVLEYISNLSC
jgi:phosphoribosylglycinamide formyltransferase-1